MIPSLFTLVLTITLFVLWFRYTCVLILNARSAQDYGKQVAAANQLAFPQLQQSLKGVKNRRELDGMQKHLDRDYRLLLCLLQHGAQFQMAGSRIERRILIVDYQVMKAWYSASRRLSLPNGRHALQEMVSIVAHLANFMGERVLCGAE